MENKFKWDFAIQITATIQNDYPHLLQDSANAFAVAPENLADGIFEKIEIPKDRSMGDYSFPTFQLARAWKTSPQAIAKSLIGSLNCAVFTNAGPYINASWSASDIAETVLPEIYVRKDQSGSQTIGKGKTIVIDFSSPNIAKPFGIGHLRSTAIGNSLYRLYKKLGYTVVGINHLGDWGTQFGKMIVAFKKWGNREDLKNSPISYLLDLYVRFHKEEETDPSLTDEARLWFKKLEEGDQEAAELWTTFKDYSLQEFQRVYDKLGVIFDHYTGESFYNDKMEATIKRLEDAGLVSESEGALIVDLAEHNLPPCLLRKADGATLYATRDLAGLFYRKQTYDFHKAIYVVGMAQQDHFKQVFTVIEKLGEEWSDDLVFVGFGWIRFGDEAMSTRKGNIILLDDVISTAQEKARAIILEKNPDLEDIDRISRMIALGAIVFADLGVKRHKDVNFRWEEVLTFEGETGPYLQYTHARLCALLRRYGRDVSVSVDFALFASDVEKDMLLHLYRFGEIVELAADRYEPSFIADYLIELAAIFNRFYQRKDEEGKLIKIISDNEAETAARMLLVSAVRTVLHEGLFLLGIEAPEEM